MDQKQMTLMNPLDQSIPIEKILGQEKKWKDAISLVSVHVRDKDPVSASSVVWMIYNGYIPRKDAYSYKNSRMELPDTWTKGEFYQATRHWGYLGLSGYNTDYD